MKTTLRLTSTLALIVALALAAFGGTAAAQEDYPPSVPTSPILTYPGPLSAQPDAVSGEPGSDTLSDNAAAFAGVDAAPAAQGTGGGDSQLAFTGSTASTLAVGGFSLMLLGGSAVVAARRRSS